MKLEHSIIFTGFRRDVHSVLCACDVAVQASVLENLGGTVEALLMERPLVATRVGGMVDAVRDGETGVLVAPADPADLARGIVQLLRDPQRAAALGQAGRRLMLAQYTLTHTVCDLHQLYARERTSARRGYRRAVPLLRAAVLAPLLCWHALRALPRAW